MEKREHMPIMFSKDDLAAMKRLRLAIDPLELSNPGKMFPSVEPPALHSHVPHPLERAGVISRE
jgi:glycolate oxidase